MYKQVFKLHSEFLKAISHPKRLEIIHLLRDNALNVTSMQYMLDIPQANLSQHLQVLRKIKAVTHIKKGKQIYYQISDQKIIIASNLFREVLINQQSNQNLKDVLSDNLEDIVPLHVDPICGMKLSKTTAAFSLKTECETLFFCAVGCLRRYEQRQKLEKKGAKGKNKK